MSSVALPRSPRPTPCLGVQRLLRRLEAHDPATAQHCLRTSARAGQFADHLGLGTHLRHLLRVAALVHDLGKLCVPSAVLNKPGHLTADEALLVREHPAHGVRLLEPYLADADVLEAVYSHHERFDGRGYPLGLKGRQVPFLARVLAIADTFDALTSGRPYRSPMTPAAGRAYLLLHAGRQFDPQLVHALFPEDTPELPGARDLDTEVVRGVPR
jgi:putative nucleotidyltransferase with HDIG domain